MKRFGWLLAGLFAFGWVGELCAQLPSYYPPPGGIQVQYNGGRVRISGYYGPGLPPGAYPFDPYNPWGPPYGVPPAGTIQRNVTYKVLKPVRIVPQDPVYDLTGEDLDLKYPPTKLGPRKPAPDDPSADKLPPGKDVSSPKEPIRPEDKQPPPKPQPPKPQPPKQPGPPPGFLKPPPPLPNPQDEAVRQIGQGVASFKNRDYGLAAQRFQQAVDLDPDNPLAHFLLAQADFAVGDYREAVAAIRAGMKRRKDWPEDKFFPREQLYKGNEADLDEQLERLDKVRKLIPLAPTFLFLAAYQRWFDNRRAEAVPLFRDARDLVPETTVIDRFLTAAAPKVVAATNRWAMDKRENTNATDQNKPIAERQTFGRQPRRV